MEYIQCLEDLLKSFMTSNKGDLQIQGWYFGINRNTSIKVGVKNNKIGEVYNCPKIQEGIRGKLYIIWQDNRRSVASLDSKTPDNYLRLIKQWRNSSFVDEEAPSIYKSFQYPDVKLFDHQTNRLVYQDKSLVFDILERYVHELNRGGIQNIDGSVSASSSEQYIKNSIGLDLSTRATSFTTYVYGDQIYGKSFSHRKIIREDELNNLIQETITRILNLKRRTPIKGGKMKIILMPEVAESFIGYYLLNNLIGSRIANHRAVFSVEDFKNNKKTIREDFDLIIDTARDYYPGSYISTFEGVPAGKVSVIQQGRLKSPILDLKYARKLNYNPTPIPSGKGSVLFKSAQMKKLKTLIKNIDKGIMIYDILGLHTQDATSGNYSLTAPNCIFIEKGEMKEACKAVISGNFFEALKQETTQFATIDFEDSPAMITESWVTGEK